MAVIIILMAFRDLFLALMYSRSRRILHTFSSITWPEITYNHEMTITKQLYIVLRDTNQQRECKFLR